MTEFTHELPNNIDLFEGVKVVASAMPKYPFSINLIDVIKDGYCEISDTGQFSKQRWDALGAIVSFFIPPEVFSSYYDSIYLIKRDLSSICKDILPPSAGYDIINVSISPIIPSKTKNPLAEIQKIVTDERYLSLSEDLINKGKRMADAYITLYALENHVRDYIHNTFLREKGSDYLNKIVIPKKTQSGIVLRKSQEDSKKWLPLRGGNDLFYLDFIELADIIINNWDYFKNYIPDQNWIKVKMQEMYDIRCLVAHNSFISDENIQLLDITTKQIIKQLYS